MRRVDWTARAINAVRDIRGYIGLDDPAAAARIADRLMAAGNSLSDFPKRGRLIGRGLRQLSTVYPYQIRYRVIRDGVTIISVRHGARR